ncbi:MAG: alpha-amylase [Chloroflexi bacterium]|nr:alpha-amylase [Chloroflexota bacterium]
MIYPRLLRITVLLVPLLLLIAPVGALNAQDDPGTAAAWWNDRVFYEIFVRSFQDSDGDGIGDLRGMIDRLDYLNDGDPTTTDDLGVTGIWLMPVTEGLSYHGYDVLDYRAIEADFGTRADFDAFMDAAHDRGIAVIVDLVINHSSVEHPWFAASAAGEAEFADWYVWADEDPGFRGPDGQVVWHPLADRFYYGLFWGGMPDLNHENPATTEAIYDITRFWLEDLGVDGLRLDAVKHIIEVGREQENTEATRQWMRDYDAFIDSVAPDALTVGEVWSSSFVAAPYVGDGVDLVFEFDLATALVQSAAQGNAAAVNTALNRVLDLYPPGQFASFLTNHDQNRVMSALRGDVDAAKVAASLLLTIPGVPFLYYGEEIGMMGVKPDERIRTPMQWDAAPNTAGFTTGTPWQPLADENQAATVADQSGDPASLLSHYRSLIHLRNAHPALQTGDFVPVETGIRAISQPIYPFLRVTPDETLLVVINLSDEAISDYGLTLDEGPLATVSGAEIMFAPSGAAAISIPELNGAGGFAAYQPLPELPPRSTLIIQLVS